MSAYGGPERRRAPGSLGRRVSDRKWPRHLRDFWMVLLTGSLVLALNAQNDEQHAICTNGNLVRQQLNDRSPLVAVREGRRVVYVPAVNANLLKLSAALTHTRQEEATVFGVFLAVTKESIRTQARTPEMQQQAATYLKALNRLIGDYNLAANLDAQVRDSVLGLHYERFPLLRC